MKTKNKLLIFFIAFLLIGTACTKDGDSEGSTAAEETPETVNTTFILFEEKESVDGYSIGSLYIKKEDEEVELIAKDVFDSATYDNETEEVLYIDDEYNLYNFISADETSIFIDENVNAMYFTDTEDKKIVYTTEDDSVYVYNNSDTEKIGSNVKQFEVIGDDVYYNTQENYLVIYNIATREEKRITNGVQQFQLLDDQNKIIYLSDNHTLYYLDGLDEESMKISSGPVSLSEVIIDGDQIYFLEYQDDANELYLGSLSESTRPERITDDVWEFKIYDNDIYYLTSDSILYKLQDNNSSKRIAFDITAFDIGPSELVFLDDEDNLYTWDPENDEKTTVGYDVESYEMFTNGELYYLNTEQELFQNNVKLASDINYYSAFYDTLAYADTQSLYLIRDGEEHVMIEDSLDEYSVIYYQNYPVYENRLTLSDISGFWKISDHEDYEPYCEIRSNGRMILYYVDSDPEEIDLDVFYSGFNQLILGKEDSNEYIEFRQDEDGTTLEVEGDSYPLEKSSRDEMNEYMESYEQKKAEEEQEEERAAQERQKAEADADELYMAEYVVEQFIRGLPDAVNYGEFYIISQYIDPSSSFYEEQSEFVWDLYDRNIEEHLYNYELISSKINEDETVTIGTREVFDVYNREKNEENRVNYQATYSLKKVNGEYLINSLSVN